jgi:hypothetical protein
VGLVCEEKGREAVEKAVYRRLYLEAAGIAPVLWNGAGMH